MNNNNEISKPISQGSNRNKAKSNIGHEEVASRLRKRISEAQHNAESQSGETEYEVISRLVYDFAIENGLWIDDLYSLGNPFVSGNENTNVINPNEGMIYKSNNLYNSGLNIITFFEKIDLHNSIFPDTNYSFVGFTGVRPVNNRVPYVEPIYSQSFIKNSIYASEKEILNYMNGIGFREISESKFQKENVIISDLYSRNVLKDNKNNIYIIDAEFKSGYSLGGQIPECFCEDHKHAIAFCTTGNLTKDKLLAYWYSNISKHFKEEETKSFPEVYSKETSDEIDSILDDHVWFYEAIEELRTAGKHEKLVKKFVKNLIAHINKEEAFWAKVNENKTHYKKGGPIPNRIYLGEEGGANIPTKTPLEEAKDMLSIGINPEIIRQETGWFLNPHDNLWRYEISDHEMKFTDKSLSAVNHIIDKNIKSIRLKLSDVLIHDKLFLAYPEFKNIIVEFVNHNIQEQHPLVEVYYNSKTIIIKLPTNLDYGNQRNGLINSTTTIAGEESFNARALRDKWGDYRGKKSNNVLAHELQHVIQCREAMGEGGFRVPNDAGIHRICTIDGRTIEVIPSDIRIENLRTSGEIESMDVDERLLLNEVERKKMKPFNWIRKDMYITVATEEPFEFKQGGSISENPASWIMPEWEIYLYAKKIKDKYPKVWELGGNIRGNESFLELERVVKRGYWLDSEREFYGRWRSFVARHQHDFRIAGVIANLKWLVYPNIGEQEAKEVIEESINKEYRVKMKQGGSLKEVQTEEYYKEIATGLYNQIDFDLKKSQTVKYKGHSFKRSFELGRYLAYHVDGNRDEYLSFSGLDRNERIDALSERIKLYHEEKISRIGKVYLDQGKLIDFVEDVLLKNNINYTKNHAVFTDSLYIKTENGTIRISDHTGSHREYKDVVLFLFPNQYYKKEELSKMITDTLVKKMEQGGTIKQDRSGNYIGDGSYHVDFNVFDFKEYPQISTNVSKSSTTESVYVTYRNENDDNSITLRFSTHENNAVKFGDQLNGYIASRDEVLAHLGLKKRIFIPKKYLRIESRQVAKNKIQDFEMADKTIQELYDLGANTDISKYKNKLAKNSNLLILGDRVEELEETRRDAFGNPVKIGTYIYSDLDKMKQGGEVNEKREVRYSPASPFSQLPSSPSKDDNQTDATKSKATDTSNTNDSDTNVGNISQSPEEAAKKLLDSLSQEDIQSLKSAFEAKIIEVKVGLQSEIESYEKEKEVLISEKLEIQSKRGDAYDYEGSKRSTEISFLLKNLDKKITYLKNKILAISNGGDFSDIVDTYGISHHEIANFTKVNTDFISFNEDSILSDALPGYIPIINEEVFRSKGYVFDSIRVHKDTYLLACNGYQEYKSRDMYFSGNKKEQAEDYEIGYVLVTLDQLALISDYYYTKAKAVETREARERNRRTEEYYDRIPRERREKHFAQKGFYYSLPEKIKKIFTEEKWESLTLEEKESHYKPIKITKGKRLVSKLEDDSMWRSYHEMYERFINASALPLHRKTKEPVPITGDRFGVFANPEVFRYWTNFRDMMKWKVKDIYVQREFISDVYRIALETSFGESNTDDSLKKPYGILIKRQNGQRINPVETEQIRKSWIDINRVYGGLYHVAESDNLKISHTGEKLVFASKAAGVYIPKWKTIAVSSKFGENQFNSIMAHEVAHWIDNSIGIEKGKRWYSDDFESTAGVLASTFRKNMNKESNSDYINSTKECFARAMEQYFSITTFGDDSEIVYSYDKLKQPRTYFSEENYVNKEKYYNIIKPLAEAFLEENRYFFRYDIDFDKIENPKPIEPEKIEEDTMPTYEELLASFDAAKASVEFMDGEIKQEMLDYIDGLEIILEEIQKKE